MAERRKFNKKERKEIYDKMQGRCAYCGIMLNIEDMQVDHVIPLHRGGTNDMSNLVPACRGRNHYKSTLTLEQFREMIWNIPDRLMHQSVAYQVGSRFDLFTTNQLAKKKRLFYFEKLKQKDIEVPRKAWKNAALDTATGRSKSDDDTFFRGSHGMAEP